MAEAVGHQVWGAWGGRYGVEIEQHIDHPVLPASTRPDPPGAGKGTQADQRRPIKADRWT